jgi:hypothetical protein
VSHCSCCSTSSEVARQRVRGSKYFSPALQHVDSMVCFVCLQCAVIDTSIAAESDNVVVLTASNWSAARQQIVFTSGATESNNMSIKGVARFYASKKVRLQTQHSTSTTTHAMYPRLSVIVFTSSVCSAASCMLSA